MRQADAVIDIMAEKGFKRGVTVKRITTNEVLLMEQAFRQHSFNDPWYLHFNPPTHIEANIVMYNLVCFHKYTCKSFFINIKNK